MNAVRSGLRRRVAPRHVLSTVMAGVLTLTLSSCSVLGSLRTAATPAPFCAPLGAEALGSVQLDYSVAPPATPALTVDEAERAARVAMGAGTEITTCSVRLAGYDNLAEHRPYVWVVHLDGFTMSALGGGIHDPIPASPPVLRRALVLVTADAPAKPVISIFAGP